MTRATDRGVLAYLAEDGRQHAFPIQALLRVQPAPVYTTGRRLAASLPPDTALHVHAPEELGDALRAAGVRIVISTSQTLPPALLRGKHDTPRCVFVGHGESDKTHDDMLEQRFVHNPINAQFDLLLLASHAHMEQQANPNRCLVGDLKHDLFVADEYAGRPVDPRRVLWAPGWGRHNSVRHHLDAVLQATAALGLELDVQLHPHSYHADADVAVRVQLEMLRHRHLRVVQSANVLAPMARSALMIGDVSTVCYDWLMFDRPILFLDHPGLSVPEEKALFDVGAVASTPDGIAHALESELADPARRSARRRARLAARYPALDGRAAERAIAEVMRRARETWGIAC